MTNTTNTARPITEVEISTDCTCEPYYESEDDFVPSNVCEGECYESAVEDFEVCILEEWRILHAIDSHALLRVVGSAMGWTRARGFTYAVANAESIVRSLSLRNADYTLYLSFDGEKLTARRTSHDEPTGASFTFEVLTEAEVEELEF